MTRAERVIVARHLRANGLMILEVARRMGVSRSAASAYLNDPDLAKQKERRLLYRRPCPECGTPMDGSGGVNGYRPERCAACSRALQSAERKWTRDSVIDAIQRFARVHGRPPTSYEWHRSDRVNGYPPFTCVYGWGSKSGNTSAPFEKWADAIEAAGFPRPRPGGYNRSDSRHRNRPALKEVEMGSSKRSFVILERSEETGDWIENDPVEAHSEALAVELFAELCVREEGRFVAISTAHWTIRELKAVTSFKAVAVDES